MSAQQTPALVLGRLPWLASVEAEVRARLAAGSRVMDCGDGQILATRGQPPGALLVVVRGHLEVCMHSRDGKRHVIRQLGAGELFGLIPIIDGGASIHDAVAQRGLTVLQMPQQLLLAELQASSRLAASLLDLLCRRSRRLYDLVASQHLLSLDARVADLLLSLWADAPPRGEGDQELHITQADLSDMLGVSRQSLNACLRVLEDRQLVERRHGRIALLDRDALTRYAREFL